jgi:hypothetical protein
MPTQVEEMKQEDGEPEPVMIGGPHKSAKRAPVKLRRGEQWYPDIAGVDMRSIPDLEGVEIDEHHSPVWSDEQVAVVDVPDDMPLFMNGCKRSRNVCSNMNQKPKIRLRKSL